jgi:hypothetical protein
VINATKYGYDNSTGRRVETRSVLHLRLNTRIDYFQQSAFSSFDAKYSERNASCDEVVEDGYNDDGMGYAAMSDEFRSRIPNGSMTNRCCRCSVGN